MIWNDTRLLDWAKKGGVTPFDDLQINPSSIDLRWSGRYRVACITDGLEAWTDIQAVEQLALMPFNLYLLDTTEFLCIPPEACGFLTLKSSMGRHGLEHLHAGFFDPGFRGTATMEVINLAPWIIRLNAGQRVVQMTMMGMKDVPSKLYHGRYQGDRAPMPAKKEVSPDG